MAKRDRYHHGDLRRALIAASLSLIEQEGVGALSLRAAARRAGVSHSAPYHHFTDRGSLLAAIAEDGFAELAHDMSAARDKATDARARLEACGLAYVQFALKSPARFKLMFRPELAAQSEAAKVAKSSAPALDVLTTSILEAQAAGLAPSGDPKPLVLTAWSAVHGLTSLWLDGPLPRAGHAFGTSANELGATLASTLANLFIGAAQAQKNRRR